MIPQWFARLWDGIWVKLRNLRIAAKIMIFYFLLLVFTISISSFLYQAINARIMSEKISEVSVQTLRSINLNINLLMDTVNNYSKMILANESVQNMLRNTGRQNDLRNQRTVTRYLIELTESTPLIEGVYLFGNDGSRYAAVDRSSVKSTSIRLLRDASWYHDVTRLKGGYILRLNSGGALIPAKGSSFVSLIRVVNDLNTQQPIGFMIINIPGKAVVNAFAGLSTKYDSRIILQTEEGDFISNLPQLPELDLEQLFQHANGLDSNSITQKIGGRSYLVSYLKAAKLRWKIISVIPFDELSKESRLLNWIAFFFILVNSVLLVAGTVLISRFVTHPIHRLLKSMKGVQKGVFQRVDIKTGNDEIGELKNGYNIMIEEIQKLIAKLVADQKIKRKAELDVLQAQIKPHFLYNTFDAISSLALAGRNTEVYQLIKALGSYYRISLNKGREIISIAEELEIVKNYLTIQQIRYQDALSFHLDIDERVYPYQIPKLILQPLVENALYHGIRPTGEPGVIAIAARLQEDCLILTVRDDGVGMTEARIAAIMEGEGSSGFGLRGTIERLRIFYNTLNVLQIASQPGCGTTLTITVPLKEAAQSGE
ncbi:two-component system sensor histidine kinase YesM [Hydrogenispora ethanolica]|jgi:two-component system sensor histidine kinase YesM|uniref:histidine kinase n=1 Tax=Hydrogenispora ethanolica TaxID=1082276 RepID=A0A4R1RXT8_HYDET|nr:sensor histidine kinase [Hydrogenispora ethanolica]TCL71573.1 two-component system sensor histidine kinase YesM [Hydrogenispora ethanolica]